MSFDRTELLHLLPCHLCGDLPPGVAEQVEAALAADAELRSMYDELVVSRDECAQLLNDAVDSIPGLLELGVVLPPARPAVQLGAPEVPPTRARGLLLGLAAAALLAIGAAASPGQDPLVDDYFATHSRAAEADALVPAGAGLRAALLAAGVEPRLAMAPDLSAQGFTLVGVLPISSPSGGVAAVYEKDGKRYVCQIYSAIPTGHLPSQVEDAGGMLLRGFSQGSRSAVSWSSGGRRCVFSGEAPVGELLAVVRRRVQPPA